MVAGYTDVDMMIEWFDNPANEVDEEALVSCPCLLLPLPSHTTKVITRPCVSQKTGFVDTMSNVLSHAITHTSSSLGVRSSVETIGNSTEGDAAEAKAVKSTE